MSELYAPLWAANIMAGVLVPGWLLIRLSLLPIARVRSAPVRRTVARLSGLLTWLAVALVAVGAATTIAMWAAFGWTFAGHLVVLTMPLTVLPAAMVLTRTRRGVRRLIAEGGELSDMERAAPAIACWAAAVNVYLAWNPPVSLGIVEVALPMGLALLGTAVLAPSLAPVPRLRERVVRLGLTGLLVAGAIGHASLSMVDSVMPDRYSLIGGDHDVDYGGGPEPTSHGHGATASGTSVLDLTGQADRAPDQRFVLTAREKAITLPSGATVSAWTYNGEAPGPELRVNQGDLVEVTLHNELPDDRVTIHWHGVDVPNAEDGVAGVTQDAVPPSHEHVYRFVAEDAGTYWYHSHQVSSQQVRRGLFGTLVVLPRDPQSVAVSLQSPQEALDLTVPMHVWRTDGDGSVLALGVDDVLRRQAVEAGTPVRIRLVNTDSKQATVSLTGTPFRVVAVDGQDISGPAEITDRSLLVAGGGRLDVTFTMPSSPVLLEPDGDGGNAVADNPPGLLLAADPTAPRPDVDSMPLLDLASYGEPADPPFGLGSDYDRDFRLVLDGPGMGFFDGLPSGQWTINGNVHPNIPMLMVAEGDLVKVTFVNRSVQHHPMHLHGHHMLVLTRNGEPTTGSPWWTDTLDVAPGETFEIGFLADNPGVWMDHCHNLDHAAAGMTLHLGYEGVTTPYEIGGPSGNQPE